MIRRLHSICGWSLVALTIAGTIEFGAVEDEVRYLFGALILLASAGVLASAERERLPPRGLVVATALFPAWLALSLVPLPASLFAFASPEAARLLQSVWPGPLQGCDGLPLVGPFPSAHPLTIDPALTLGYLLICSAACCALLAAVSFFSGPSGHERRHRLLWILALFVGIEALYGLGEWFSASPMVVWIEKSAYLDSATGTLINRNHYAMLLYWGCAAALTLLGYGVPERQGEEQKIRRVSLFTIAIAALVALVASKSRAGLILGLLVLLPAFYLIWRRSRGVARWGAVLVATLLALPVVLVAVPSLFERLEIVNKDWSDETSRGAVLRHFSSVVPSYPLFGTGGGSWELTFLAYRPPEMQARYDQAHNDYFQTIVECGAVGLGLALLSVAFVVAGWRRRWKERRDSFPWPIAAALAATLLHEFVDFSLRMPALAVWTALLAGAWYLPRKGASQSPRAVRSVAVVAAVLFVPSSLYGMVHAGIGSPLGWPRIPEVEYRRAVDAWNEYRDSKPKSRPLFCAALAQTAVAESLRPLGAVYSVREMRLATTALRDKLLSPSETVTLRDQAERAAERARRSDPFNSNLVRDPLMRLELAQGNLDLALADAAIVANYNLELATQTIDFLLDSNVPPEAIVEQVVRKDIVYRMVLEGLAAREQIDALKRLVPPDLAVTARNCSVGSILFLLSRDHYHIPVEPFLRRCKALPEIQNDVNLQSNLDLWIAYDLIVRKEFQQARPLVEKVADEASRLSLLLDIAHGERDWPLMLRVTRRQLDMDLHWDAHGQGWILTSNGLARAHAGDVAGAIAAYEKALSLNPEWTHLEPIIRDLKLGIVPP